ncbi:hypothetical protein B0H12DRAFT_1289151 [Mycena haematopus]|nr:hypothetical protein B0H12DRAFT_1289151 [Mycena haematopus]
MASLTPLPLDLLRPIVSHVTEKKSLLQLCRVSRNFLCEAQSRLFTDVSLKSSAVSSFCRTLSVSPTLAVCVQRLSIQLANGFTDMVELARTLRSLPNLRALEITQPQPQPWADVLVCTRESMLTPWKHSTDAHILQGCPFRLRVFGSAFRIAEPDFIAFLADQHEIEELGSFDTTGDVITLSAAMLPRLKKFKTTVPRLQFETATEWGFAKRMFREERMDIKIQMGSEFS